MAKSRRRAPSGALYLSTYEFWLSLESVSSATSAIIKVFSLEHADAHSQRRSARKSGFRRLILTAYGEMPWWHGDENGPLDVSLTGCDRSKGV